MSRMSMFNSPLLLGFDQLERALDRLAKNAEGYPPYNIERIGENGLRITLALAGFTADDLAIELVENQLTVRGKQTDEGEEFSFRAKDGKAQFLLAPDPSDENRRILTWTTEMELPTGEELTADEWGQLQAIHLDHHLRQFGV